VLTDSGGEWTADVEAEYAAWRKRLQLFSGDHEAYFVSSTGTKQLYPYRKVNWLGDRLSKRIGELVFPGFPRLFAKSPAEQALVADVIRSLRVTEITYPTALMVSWGGLAPWKLYRSPRTGEVALTLWGVQAGEFAYFDYLPGDRAAPYAVNCWYETSVPREGKQATCRVNERYFFDGRRVRFTHRAWLVGPWEGLGARLEGVPLAEAYPAGVAVPPEEGEWPARELPVWSIPNVDLLGIGVGDSDYSESLVDIQRQVNAVAAQRALVVALTGLPHFQVPRRMIGPDGTFDLKNIWLEIEYEGEETTPIRITNWDGNLKLTDEQLERLDKEFMHCSILSPAIDGQVMGGGSESGYARRLSMVKLEAGIWRRRTSYEPAFEWLIRNTQELRNAWGLGRRRRVDVDLTILWPPPIPDEIASLGQFIQAVMQVGAMSVEAGVRRINPTESNEWIEAEVGRIRSDQELMARAAAAQRVVD